LSYAGVCHTYFFRLLKMRSQIYKYFLYLSSFFFAPMGAFSLKILILSFRFLTLFYQIKCSFVWQHLCTVFPNIFPFDKNLLDKI